MKPKYMDFGCVGNIPISSSQEACLLALDHGVGVKMHDALTLHDALHGTAWSLALGVRVGVGPFCKLQNVPYLE